jgi:hypothetical protein
VRCKALFIDLRKKLLHNAATTKFTTRGSIKSVNNDENGSLVQEHKYVLQFIFTVLLCAAFVMRCMTMLLIGELSNERKEQVAMVLLVDIPKIGVKASHGSQSIGR